MYRRGADPRLEHELYRVGVIRSGRAWMMVPVVTVLAVWALLILIAMVVSRGTAALPGEVAVAALAAALALVAVPLRRARRQMLRVVRFGDATQVVVGKRGVALDLPVRCLGAQFRIPMGRVVMHNVTLQIVDTRGRSIVLSELRPKRDEAWDLPPLDPRVESSVAFDVEEAGKLGELRGWLTSPPA